MNEITLFDILERHGAQRPDATSYVFRDSEGGARTLTFSQLLQSVRSIAACLQKHHTEGDRILLMYQPGLDFIKAILACFAAGMVAVPVQPIQNRRVLPRLTGIIANAGCNTLLTNSTSQHTLLRIFPDIAALTPGVEWLCTDTIPNTSESHFQKPLLDSSSLAFLQYTSGSTGTPKGVMVSHRNLLNNESLIQSAFGHDTKTIFTGWLPLYHDMGLIGNVFQPLYLGIPSVLFSPMTFLMSPITWLRTISEWRATTSGAPSFAYELCVNRISDEDMEDVDLSSWKIAYNGAEPVKAKVINEFVRKFARYGFCEEAFYPCYGMAEATLFVTGGTPDARTIQLSVDAEQLARNIIHEKEGSNAVLVGCGRSHGGHDVKVVSPESLEVLPHSQVGEIWVAGPSVARGYWGKPDLSMATFQAYTADGAGPYLRTGDLGFWHQDELFVTGRLKDLIIVRGQNHYPDDIEATVYGGHEALKSGGTAAFTIDEEGNAKLIVVAEVERHVLARLDEKKFQEILVKVRKDVSDVHGLRIATLVLIKPATLPKTSSGKVRRSYCRDLYRENKLECAALQTILPAGQTNVPTTLAQ